MESQSGITSKLNALLRLGLVSKNNVRRAMYVFQNPEKAARSPQYRTLMQELLIDVVDRIINNKSLYAMVRQTLAKDSRTPEAVAEDVGEERTKTLLRSGLVKKKDIVVARRALSSKKNMKTMAAVGAYRELMIDMLDSMAKKITGNPTLFNAFKRTMGDSQADESFESPNVETILEFGLDQDVAELLESFKPRNAKLWTEAKKKSKGKFESCGCSKCEEAWAMKWYNEQDGDWTPISEGKTFSKFMKNIEQVDEVKLTPKQKKLDINKNKKLDSGDFEALRASKVAEETKPVDPDLARKADRLARAKKLARAAMKAAASKPVVAKEQTEQEYNRAERERHAAAVAREKAAFGAEEKERNKRGPVKRFISRVADRVDPNRVKTRQQHAARWSRNQDEHESMVGASPHRREGPTATERARKAANAPKPKEKA